MAVKIKGGSFAFSEEVDALDASFSNYFSWLFGKNDSNLLWPYHIQFEDFPDETKRLYIFSNDKYWYGVVVSGKTKQFQHILTRENGKTTIKAIKVKGEPPVELNFFCIRQDSGKGIYSHYFGSYQFRTFIKDLWGTYRQYVSQKKDQAILLGKLPKGEIDKIYSIAGRCLYGPLYTPDEFTKLLKKLAYIEEVRFTTYEIDSDDDIPVEDIFNSKREVYNFNSELPVTKKVKDWIASQRTRARKILKDNKLKYTGSVYGYDSTEQPISIDFDKTMQNFLNYDYDKLGSIEIDNLINHDIIKLMILRLENDQIFRKNK